jgi:hypothetical protein
MSELPTVEPGTFLVIRCDGSREVVQKPPALKAIYAALSIETGDTVILSWEMMGRVPDLVMVVDDDGWETRMEKTERGFRLIPIRPMPGKQINPAATDLYRMVALGSDHQIVGDVAILHDKDVAAPRRPL